MKPMSEKQVARWEKQRTKGKWFWIFRSSLIWAFWMLLVLLVMDWFYQRPLTSTFFMIPFLILGGFLVGFVGWWGSEGKYQSYLLDNKIKKGLKL